MSMEALLRRAVQRLAQGHSLAFAAVAERTGSAPRGPGALLLVEPDVPALGTVGGGLLEARAQALALDVLTQSGGRAVSFSLEHDGLSQANRQTADVTLWLQALPAGDGALLTALEGALERFSSGDLPGPEDCALLMSRSHDLDLLLLRAILPAEPAFLGVLGSRKKGAFLRAALAREGFSQAQLERMVLPVGLPLGGETPAEIALSVAAQLVQLRSRGELSFSSSKKSEKNC